MAKLGERIVIYAARYALEHLPAVQGDVQDYIRRKMKMLSDDTLKDLKSDITKGIERERTLRRDTMKWERLKTDIEKELAGRKENDLFG
ncbi:hypothetical protein [Dialister invisus]|uniref:hypothetical protein n=1 Tax=Dialister invisus TaxID=218538 RepID=UPI002671AE75|nr:hypothetical protein [Dialister invisus]